MTKDSVTIRVDGIVYTKVIDPVRAILEVNNLLKQIIERECRIWGVTVPAVEIKDVILPPNMQRAMAAEAETERERRAKKISSLGELEAAENLAAAARTIAEA